MKTKKIKCFKSKLKTNRFNKNQIVWIANEFANHMRISYRFRGNGRMVKGLCDKHAPYVGEIKEIKVDVEFYNRITSYGF